MSPTFQSTNQCLVKFRCWKFIFTMIILLFCGCIDFSLFFFFFFVIQLLRNLNESDTVINWCDVDVIGRSKPQRVWFWVSRQHHGGTILCPNQCVCKRSGQQGAKAQPLVRPHQGFSLILYLLESTSSCVSTHSPS